MSDYEPPAEMVEALAKELCGAYVNEHPAASVWEDIPSRNRNGYLSEARFVLRRQHEREAAAKLALRYLAELGGGNSEGNIYARRALERWEKLDAPKVPTLADAVEQIERECPGRVIATLKDSQAWTIIKLAAVEREERK